MELKCPACSKPLVSEKSFFCVYCGQRVRDSFVENVGPDLEDTVKTEGAVKPTVKKFNPVSVFLILISLLFLLVSFYLKFGKNISIFKGSEIISPVEESSKEKSYDLSNQNTTLKSGSFLVKYYSETVPVNVSSFILLNNFSSFYTDYLEKRKTIDFKELFGISMDEALSFVDESFAICISGDSWAYLFKVKNPEFVAEKISGVASGKAEDLDFSLVDDFLVVSNDPSLIEDVASAHKGVSLSLSKDAVFAEAVKNLSVEGTALVFSRDLNLLKPRINEIMGVDIPNTVVSSAFVAKKTGVGAVLEF